MLGNEPHPGGACRYRLQRASCEVRGLSEMGKEGDGTLESESGNAKLETLELEP